MTGVLLMMLVSAASSHASIAASLDIVAHAFHMSQPDPSTMTACIVNNAVSPDHSNLPQSNKALYHFTIVQL